MPDDKRAPSPMDRVWDFFISVKLAIITLIVLAVTSIFGTIIEQNQPPEKYHQIYEDWAFALMDRINLFDMYHAWWFLLLLVLFTVNLACCTIDRFPRMWKVVRNPRTKLDGNLEKTLSQVDRWKKKGTVPDWASKYAEALSSAFAKPVATEEGGEVHLYAESGVASRFGVYVTHLSIIIIFIGAIVGNVLGFKGYVNIPEGESVSQVPVRGGSRVQELGFTVRCNSFRVETYPSGQPKAYISDLTVLEGGREVLRKKDVVVNDPLQYKGIWFYQSSYGQAGGATAQVAVRKADGSPMGTLALPPNEPMRIEGYGTVRGVNYDQNLQGNGPALQLVVDRPGKPSAEFWVYQSRPDLDRQRNDSLVFSFSGLNVRQFTGLQVAKDPGVNVVWLGCALMVVGIIMAFFLSHQRVWVRLSKSQDGRVEVVLAGAASRNRLAFEKRFEKIQTGVKAAEL
ncbi:MAG: cytochrome c biogenesis protein ResB [Deltaproteobacteria bacterium]|nr:cytochrome c biogenesis protein ResB [candidate division KSB1 bacterium]MBI5905724.1 cytochrome c biogenesis protein ResB [Deltaproteobacteria bacterium]